MRLRGEMTGRQFYEWCKRHRVNYKNSGEMLGIAQESYYRYRQMDHVPRWLAHLCDALDLIHDYETVRAFSLTPDDLANICADTTKRC